MQCTDGGEHYEGDKFLKVLVGGWLRRIERLEDQLGESKAVSCPMSEEDEEKRDKYNQ